MPRASLVSLRKYHRVGSASRPNTRIDDNSPPQHQRITQHHVCQITIPTRHVQYRTTKTNSFKRVWLILPDSIVSQWGSLIDTLSQLQSLGAPAEEQSWDPFVREDTNSLSLLHMFFGLFGLLSDLLEHYPFVVWVIFLCVVVSAVHTEDVLGGGVFVIRLESEV